jgi:hydroxymethylpyrimidine pyrophosphatase-like HAD family hydrolase
VSTPPRLVATDLDGTLLRGDGGLSDRTRGVLAALEDRGVPVVLVTARPLRWMEELWPVVGRHGLAIVSNGAILYDVHAGEVRALTGIEPAEGRVLTEAITRTLPGATYAVECLSGLVLGEGFVDPDRVPPPGSRTGPLAEVWTETAAKLMVRHPTAAAEELREGVRRAVADRATPSWTVDHLVEVAAAGVTKAWRLEQLCAGLGVPASEVAAFGDMPNDVPMLEWAGRAYAVANAHPDVVAAADEVVPSHDEDGVARTLERLFGGA